MRFPLYFLVAIMLSTSGVSHEDPLGSMSEGIDWPMAQQNPKNTNAIDPSSSGTVSIEDFALSWSFDWGEYQSAPLSITDLDGDDALEVVLIGDWTGRVGAVTLGSSALWQKPGDGARSYSTPLVVDLDRDGRKDVIYGTEAGRLYRLDNEGDEVWSRSAPVKANAQALAYDFDQDGQDEILFSRYSHTSVYGHPQEMIHPRMNGFLEIVSGSGDLLWRYDQRQGTTDYKPALVDFDRDGRPDLVGGRLVLGQERSCLDCPGTSTANLSTVIYGVKVTIPDPAAALPFTRQLAESFTYEIEGMIPVRSPAAADVTGDGWEEVIVVTADVNPWTSESRSGDLRLLGRDGVLLDSIAFPDPAWFGLSVADLSGDGVPDIAVGTTQGVSVYGAATGSLVHLYSVPVGPVRALAAADLDGDGPAELVYGTHAFQSDGTRPIGSVGVIADQTVAWEHLFADEGITDLAIVSHETAENLVIAGISETGMLYMFASEPLH